MNEKRLWKLISQHQLAVIECEESNGSEIRKEQVELLKKQIIELANNSEFSYSVALYLLKNGFKVSCRDWNKTGMFIYIQNGTTIKKEMARNEVLSKIEGDINIKSHIDLCDDNNIYVGWKPTTKDLFSERWILKDIEEYLNKLNEE